MLRPKLFTSPQIFFGCIISVFLHFVPQLALAQSPRYPFPQHVGYTSGTIKPNTVTQSQLDDSTRSFYNYWKSQYLLPACSPNQYYIQGGTEIVNGLGVSEGQGYGMLIAAFMAGYDPNARTYFDGLYRYYRAHPSENNHDLMAWKQITGCKSSADSNSATDGDEDIAYALLLADKQWGSAGSINYLQAAQNIMNAIMQDEVNPVTFATKLGDWATSSDAMYHATRTSDFMLNHFRAFSAATGDSRWDDALDECYSLISTMQTNFSPATGLLPDFIKNVNTNPIPANANFLESPNDGHYDYNACRDPWRIAVDYLISGDSRALTALNKLNLWIRSSTFENPDNIHPGYFLNGNPTATDYQSNAFNAPLAVGAMVNANNQTWLNNLWTNIESVDPNSEGYYENSLKMLSLLVLSGNWWNPQVNRTISFSGYDWFVKTSSGKVGPGPNYFSDSTGNVWTDAQGRLHLKITKQNSTWNCSEVGLNQSLGYGRYVFQVTGGAGRIDPNVVLGLFTWDDAPAQNHREIDIEFSRWGDALDTTTAQFVVQPYDISGNLVRWTDPPMLDSCTVSFDWQPDHISFLGVKRHQSVPPYDSIITSWNYSGSSIPSPGNEHVGINLWLSGGTAPTNNQEAELVISKFELNPPLPPPIIPVLVSPADGALNQPTTATLRWNSSPNASSYRLQVAADSLFTMIVVDDSLITDTSKEVSNLNNYQKYYWRANARDSISSSGFSLAWKFTTKLAPPKLLGASGLSTSPLLRWNISSGSVAYRLQVAGDSLFASTVFDDSTLSDTTRTIGPLSADTSYWWRVMGMNTNGASDWSVTLKFYTSSNGVIVSTLMHHRWNLVSVPVYPANTQKNYLFPGSISSAYPYQGSYPPKDTLQPGIGYWLKFPAQQVVSLTGDPIAADTIAVKAGWNLIGSITQSIPTSGISSIPSGLIGSNFFGYSNSYTMSNVIEPMRGYWIKANNDGKLVLTSSVSFAKTPERESILMMLNQSSSITFEDAGNNEQTLYFRLKGKKEQSIDFFELPPKPPEGIFDVRFASGRMLEAIGDGEKGEFPLSVSAIDYPLNVRWELKDFSLTGALQIGDQNISMKLDGECRITSPESQIVLKLHSSFSLPAQVTLEQNYPNPFNPVTNFEVRISNSEFVSLKVYDVLGKEITTLLNQTLQPGVYTSQWDASNMPSGVYFYRLQTETSLVVKKMVLMK